MITVLNRKSVYIGTNMQDFSRIRTLLSDNRIPYSQKTKNRMGQWTGHGTLRGRTGSLGQPSDTMYEHEVFVHQDDYEKAMHLIQKG